VETISTLVVPKLVSFCLVLFVLFVLFVLWAVVVSHAPKLAIFQILNTRNPVTTKHSRQHPSPDPSPVVTVISNRTSWQKHSIKLLRHSVLPMTRKVRTDCLTHTSLTNNLRRRSQWFRRNWLRQPVFPVQNSPAPSNPTRQSRKLDLHDQKRRK
jgi:hypothetical protein